MHLGRGGLRACFITAFCLCDGLQHRIQAQAQPQGIAAELQNLNAHAADVFVGQITSIQRKTGFVEIRFRVEQQVRGRSGSTYVMQEWSGLWAPGHLRYQVGDRVLAFVHGTGRAGLTSPVHGAEGLVPVVVQGARAQRLLDIRRVAASVVRAPGTPLPTEENGAIQLSSALSLFDPQNARQTAEPARFRLSLRGQAPRALRPPVALQSSNAPSPGTPQLQLSAPVIRRGTDVRR